MNKSIISVLTLLACTACTYHGKLYDEKKFEELIMNCETSEEFVVPIKEGYATFVTCGEDTLAITTQPMTIKIPKQSSVQTKSSSSESIQIDFGIIDGDITYSKYWQAVMFEDTQHGDYDYNDLVFHVENKMDKTHHNQKINIQAIALGSTKTIKLGCILCDGTEFLISENVRRDLFNNATGFINTDNEKPYIPYKKLVPYIDYTFDFADPSFSTSWFIEVEGKRYFAISADKQYADYTHMFNSEGMPYGLVVYGGNGTFTYPEEKRSIFAAYKDARAWMNGDKESIGSPTKQYCYQYSYRRSGTYYVWDYER